MADKIDSNVTGLRFAEELTLKVLPSFTDPVAATGALTFGGPGNGGTLATGTLTFSGPGTDGEVIVIGSRTYTLRNSISATANAVLIGASAAATAENLRRAINLDGVSGTNYGSSTTIHANVSAANVGAVVTVTAKAVGTAANAYATTTTSAAASWGAATMTGGAAGDQYVIGSRTYNLVSVLSSPTAANEILLGASAAATAANLTAAINAEAGIGGIYSVGTTIHPQVSAALVGSVVNLTAKTAGAAANSFATTETSSAASFAAATLLGGADAIGIPPNWHALEPNSYSDFGGQIATVSRNPINPSRQRKKGVTSDLDASGGFNQDLTFDNTTRLLQGFFFADIREKKTTRPMNSAAVVITGVSNAGAPPDEISAASGLLGFLANQLVLCSGFGTTANNGVKLVTSGSTNTALNVVNDSMVTEASPPAAATVKAVGYQFDSATVNITMNGSLVRLTRASGAFDMTTLGLIPGEWIFLGGDGAAFQFANNYGFARVQSVAATFIQFDKVSWAPTAETGTGKTVRIFFGDVLKNENAPSLIKRRTYQLERTLGEDDDGTMSEYLVGAVANEFTLNVAQADKVTADLAFIAVDNEQRTGLQGLKDGARPTLVSSSAYNTSSDFARIKLTLADPDNASPTPLFGFATEMTLSVNNNASPNKAIGVLGAFDVSVGTFEVGGSMTAYFSDINAVRAVRENSDVTLDWIVVKDNRGIVFDIPLLSLGDGRLSVEQDQPITIPLETNAAESSFGHTLLLGSFSYLPDLAG